MSKARWSKTEIDFLKKTYENNRAFCLAEAIGRSIKAIYLMARRLNLKSPNRKCTEGTKRKISEIHKSRFGRNPELRKNVSAWIKNHIKKKGHSRGMLGKKHTEEFARKMKERNSGKGNGNWKGGISKLPYRFDFNKELKDLIRKRDPKKPYITVFVG